jgi:outer membrane protein assembly factor BamB
LVGEKLYVFTRQGDDEVLLCLNAADGKQLWRNKYAAAAKAFTAVAQIKVADTQTCAYPIVSGKRVFVKDEETLTLWTVQ